MSTEALIELWLTGLRSFTDIFGGLPESCMHQPLDGEGTTPLAVGNHVIESVWVDATYCLQTAGLPGPDPACPALKTLQAVLRPLGTKAEILAEGSRAADLVPPALARLTNEHLAKTGSAGLSAEMILEHAIVHFHRHIRQLELRMKPATK